ncbi:MAG: aminodeoxychorismate/anthranilate synthase component II [Phototrophicaceae bacterium]
MILIIDNYDSFTYNIVQELGELGADIMVRRNDKITLDDIRALNPDHIIISPGPGFPKDAGISSDVIREFGATIPLLGICLGHQCIGEVYGGKVIHAPSLMHGKTSPVTHQGDPLFNDVPSPFTATRYHSLVVEEETLPDELEIIAVTDEGEIMGVRHKIHPVIGVQFHPESILTDFGMKILQNFLEKTYLKVQA